MKDLRLRTRLQTKYRHNNNLLYALEYRFARENGWTCCDRWHTSPEAAADCLENRLTKKAVA